MIKVLLVDDNAKYLRDALAHHGYEVHTAGDGVQALETLAKESFDIILLDVMMPKINGWETLVKLRRGGDNTPVIMVTAEGDDRKMVYGLKNGADDYIVKPFILPNLLARMEAVLRRGGKCNREFPQELPKTTSALTAREKEILALVAQGASNKEIADKLVVREVTVKTHLGSIFRKLKVANRTQATLVAMNLGVN
jgi:DNA-binding NarL/FixJ family response regulator